MKVIGLGNPLMGDDGIGIAVVQRLAAMNLPPEVEVLDGGTGGLTLLELVAEAEMVLLIDAVEMGRPAGTVARFTPEEIRPAGAEGGLTPHGAGLLPVLALGREMELLPPRIVIFGIEPATVEPRHGLSPAVAAAVEEVLGRVLAEVG